MDNACSPSSSINAAMRGFSKLEYQHRLGRLKKLLSEQEIDVYIGTTPENILYFTGFDPLGLYFYQNIIFAPGWNEPLLLTHKCEKELARTQSWLSTFEIWEHGEDPVSLTIDRLHLICLPPGVRVGLEMDNWYLKTSTYRRLVSEFPAVEFVDVTDTVLRLRSVKSAQEIERLREAASFSDIGFNAVVENLKPGVREIDLLASVQAEMTSAGSEYPTLPFIIASGPRSGLFHGVPTARRIAEGDLVMIEITGVSDRYNSNIVRTLSAGRAASKDKKLWDIVNESFWVPFEKIRPGVSVSEIDKVSREIRREYAKFIPARSGFGMGLAYPPVWAGHPDILYSASDVLEAGMVFSLEPSIGQYDDRTMIYGYNILVTEDGAEILQQTPRDTFEVT